MLQQIGDNTHVAVDLLVITVTSSEADAPDLFAMSAEDRDNAFSELKAAVPPPLHVSIKTYSVKSHGEVFNPVDLTISEVAKYVEGHARLWPNAKVAKAITDAGDWRDVDPCGFVGDCEDTQQDCANLLYDVTVGSYDAVAVVGYDESEFGQADPAPPRDTVEALVACVQCSVAEAEAVVAPAFPAFLRLLKANVQMAQIDKADGKKAARIKRLRHGKDGGYGAADAAGADSSSSDTDTDGADGADPAIAPVAAKKAFKSTVDCVMTERVRRNPTNGRNRVSNFMVAAGTDPTTSGRLEAKKDHVLAVRTSSEFLNRVVSVVDVVVRDHFKPLSERVHRPVGMGGIAGGTKYIVDNILFKFANPTEGPYLGSYELANKATGHDLRGAISIFHAIEDARTDDEEVIVNLNTSLMALVDHLGFRVHAQTLLDLGPGSLKVGSGDACDTVPHGARDGTELPVNDAMCMIARRLGLAVHEIKVGNDTVRLGFGADVEAHMDKNGVGRVLDTARVFPPEHYSTTTVQTSKKTGKKLMAKCFPGCPGRKLKGKEKKKACVCPPRELLSVVDDNLSIYWRLLRPELLTVLKDKDYGDGLEEAKGLSSDGFSRFAATGSDSAKHNARLRVATEFLMNVQVPAAACALVARPTNRWADGAELTVVFHRLGVNMRHAGAVWSLLNSKCKKLRAECEKLGSDPSKKTEWEEAKQALREHESARRAVVQEMFVRAAKNLLRRDLRGVMEMGAGAHEIVELVSKAFTGLTPTASADGAGANDTDVNLDRVWNGVKERFGVGVTEKQRGSVHPIRAVWRVAETVGVRLTQSCEEDTERVQLEVDQADARGQRGGSSFTFTSADIESMTPKASFLDVDDFAQGETLREQARVEAAGMVGSTGEASEWSGNDEGYELVRG